MQMRIGALEITCQRWLLRISYQEDKTQWIYIEHCRYPWVTPETISKCEATKFGHKMRPFSKDVFKEWMNEKNILGA